MSLKRAVIWELENSLSLEQILELLKLNYDIEIPFLINFDIPEDEKFLKNKWEPFYNKKNIDIEVLEDYDIQYIAVKAYIEEKLPEKLSVINKSVVNKNNRIKKIFVDVIFFEIENKKFISLFIKKSYETSIRSSLLGGGKNSKLEHKAWGKINFNSVLLFGLDENFFYWLLTKNSQKIKISKDEIHIIDINSVGQKNIDLMTKHNSNGDKIMDSTITKAGIGTSVAIEEIGVTFNDYNSRIKAIIKYNGEVSIDMINSHYFLEGNPISFVDNNLSVLIFKVYVKFIWELKNVYEEEKNNGMWTENNKANICKQKAIAAIKELMSKNKIKLTDL